MIDPTIDASISAHVTPTDVGHKRRGSRRGGGGAVHERVLAPRGQLVLDGSPGQLGLDGRVYAVAGAAPTEPATPEAPEARSAESSSRSDTESSAPRRTDEGNQPSQSWVQGSLPLREWDLLSRLDPMHRIDVQRWGAGGLPSPPLNHRSRARQSRIRRPAMGSSLTKCLTVPHPNNKGDIALSRDEFGATHPRGLCTCGSNLCAGCGPASCRKATVQLELVQEREHELYPEGGEAMFSPTVPHLATDGVDQTLYVLYKSRSALRATPEWRALDEEYGIAADVWSLDPAFGGPNGTHPHFHGHLAFERLPLVTPRASMQAELRELIAKQDRQLQFKHGLAGRWETRFAVDEATKPLHARTPKDLADDPATPRIALLIKLLDEMPSVMASTPTIPFRDASSAFKRDTLAEIEARLVPAWARCVERFMLRSYGRGIDDRPSFDRQSFKLTPGDHAASYVVGWGLEHEIASTTSKGHSHMRLLDLMAAWRASTIPWQQHAAQTARQLYREFIVAMRHRPWIFGLTAACKKFGITKEDIAERAEQVKSKRLADAKKKGEALVTPLEYVIRRRHWPAACDFGLGPTFAWINETAEHLEAAGYRTAKQREAAAAIAASTGPPAADRQLSFERERAQGVRCEPILDLEVELQRRIDRHLENLMLAFYARDRERYRGMSR